MTKKFSGYDNTASPADNDRILYENAAADDSFNQTFAQLKSSIIAGLTKKYVHSFLIADWAAGAIDITSETHGLGPTKYLVVSVYLAGSPNELVYPDVSVSDAGTVRLASDISFDGYCIITG